MQLTLPESSHRRSRAAGGTLLSTVLHAAAISAAVAGTAISAPSPVRRDTLEKIVFVKAERKDPLPPPRESPPQNPPDRSVGRPPLVPATPPPPDIILDPTLVPTTIPDVGTALGAIPEGRTETATASAFGGSGSANGTALDGAAFSAMAVDEEVVVLQGAAPRYPPSLASAGIEGIVMARYVVDTLGRVERGSIDVTSNSNSMFAQSVRDALGRMRFIPAKAQGRKVRQLVQQPFTFELTRR